MANERFNELDRLNNHEIVERYRLDREGLEILDEILSPVISPATNRATSLPSMAKILITLRYFATGGIQLNDGDIHRVSQPTVSRCVAEVSAALSSHNVLRQFIRFPSTEEDIRRTKEDFLGVANFPNVVGVIDGTHIQIKATSHDEPAYVNRMNYHSINTQIVVDAQGKLLNLVARWPGSTHDSRVWRESGMFEVLRNRHVPVGEHGYLLGDSGYPCHRWLLTPFLRLNPGAEMNYNRAHKRTRAIVERGIGQLKRRWGILHGEIRLNPAKTCDVILACGVLQNICKNRNLPPVDELPVGLEDNEQPYNGHQEGLPYRPFICGTYF